MCQPRYLLKLSYLQDVAMERAYCTWVFNYGDCSGNCTVCTGLRLFDPFGESEFRGRSVRCLTLGTQKAKAMLLQHGHVTPGKERLCYKWWKHIFWAKMWATNPTVTERNLTNVTWSRSTFNSDLPTKGSYKLKAGKNPCPVSLSYLLRGSATELQLWS